MNMKEQLAIQEMYTAKKNQPVDDTPAPVAPAPKKPAARKSKVVKSNGQSKALCVTKVTGFQSVVGSAAAEIAQRITNKAIHGCNKH